MFKFAMGASDLTSRLRAYEEALTKFWQEINKLRQKVKDEPDRAESIIRIWSSPKWRLPIPWDIIGTPAHDLHQAIMAVKDIPKGKEKALEMAGRPFYTSGTPTNILAWSEKNQKYLDFLLEAAKTWPERTGEGAPKVGPFTVVNVVGATGRVLDGTLEALRQVIHHIPAAPVPGASKVLYGDVHLVGRIKQERAMAWYYHEEDLLYVRPLVDMELPHNIAHELGHRYWRKFMSAEAKKAWSRHHTELSWKHVEFHLEVPKVGDVLQDVKGNPVVTRVEQPSGKIYYNDPKTGKEVFVSFSRLWDVGRQNADLEKFPTIYSAKADTEHFAESFALATFGKLTGDHLAAFQAAFST